MLTNTNDFIKQPQSAVDKRFRELRNSQVSREEDSQLECLQLDQISKASTKFSPRTHEGHLSDNYRYGAKLKQDITNFVVNTPKNNVQVLLDIKNIKGNFSGYNFLNGKVKNNKARKTRKKSHKIDFKGKGDHMSTFDKNKQENRDSKKKLSKHISDYIQKADNKFKNESINKHNMINKGLQKSKKALMFQRQKFIKNMKTVKRDQKERITWTNKKEKEGRHQRDRLQKISNYHKYNKGEFSSKKEVKEAKRIRREAKKTSMLKKSFKGDEVLNFHGKKKDSIGIDGVKELQKLDMPAKFHRYRRSNDLPNISNLEHLRNDYSCKKLPRDDDFLREHSHKRKNITHKEHEFCNVFKIIDFLDKDDGLKKQKLAIREKMKLMKEKTSLKSNCVVIERHNDEKAFLNDFSIHDHLGEGSYAKVKLISSKLDKEYFALKIYKKISLDDALKTQNLQREIELLATLDHENIVKFNKAIEAKNHVYIIMEFISRVSLQDFMDSQPAQVVPEDIVRRLFFQLTKAVAYLHDKSIVHRDIKLQNILLRDHNNLKLIDFGFACEVKEEELTMFCGTPSYMAPEIVMRKPYNGKAADVWALGVILYKMLTGLFPFRAYTEKDLFSKIKSGNFNRDKVVSDSGLEILDQILKVNPEERMTARDILENKWFADEVKKDLQKKNESKQDFDYI